MTDLALPPADAHDLTAHGPVSQRVLLIDDDVMIRQLVRARLAGEPFDLHVAATAEEGVALAASLRPDVVLLDVELTLPDAEGGPAGPAPDGFEVCRRLQADPALAGVQVIFLSTHASVPDRTHGLDLGAVDFVAKPFDPAELRARVRAGLRTKRLLDLLATRAQRDGLSGLWNRSFFNDRLAAEVARSNRYGTPLSLVMLDVDRFKAINDRFGHPAGDEVLRHVSATLRTTGRIEDVVCRYGGEEFAVIAPGTPEAGAVTLAERLRVALAAAPLPALAGLAITASFGVATIGPADDASATPASLLARADAGLYQAKQAGRNRVVCAPAAVTRAAA